MVIVLRIVKTANREDPDQTASSEVVWSGPELLVMAYLVSNYSVVVLYSEPNYCCIKKYQSYVW